MEDTKITPEEVLKLKQAAQAEQAAQTGAPEGTILGPQVKAQIQVVGDKGIIKGYASIFKAFDSYNERVKKGAFKRSIEESFKGLAVPRIKVLSQHRWDEPIGLPTVLKEDGVGLYFEAEVSAHPDNEAARKMRALMTEGLVDGVSIGYRIRPGGITDLGEKDFDPAELVGPIWMWPAELTDLNLLEFSPVTFPANWGARLEVVKSLGRVQVPGYRFASLTATEEDAEPGSAKQDQGAAPHNDTSNDGGAPEKAAPQDDTKSQQQALADALAGFVREDDQRRLVGALKTLGG